MRSNHGLSSSLRDLDAEVKHDFYNDLAIKLLVQVDHLSRQSSRDGNRNRESVDMGKLKHSLGISVDAVLKCLEILKSENLVNLTKSDKSSYKLNNFLISISPEGESKLQDIYYNHNVYGSAYI